MAFAHLKISADRRRSRVAVRTVRVWVRGQSAYPTEGRSLMNRTVLVASLILGAMIVGTASRCSADAVATFWLGTPTVTASEVDIPVSLLFSSGNAADTIEAIQLSVIGSDPLLTASDTDFSRFTFDVNTTTLSGWLQNP